MSGPIEHGSKLNEAEERCGEFFIARADAAVTFDAAEEVFNRKRPAEVPGVRS